ncbi:MAG: class I SAM-dependent methyltransferase [Thiobacillus sp.]|nr:class I SAM-dependent methyltransferase [Thiobacillus sp.]
MNNLGLTLTVHVMNENIPRMNVKARSLFRSVWNWLGAALVRPHAVETDEKPASLDFEKIYEDNLFLGTESRSGKGSSLFQTRIVREEIPKLLDVLKIEHLLDVPCGDWNWMRHVNLPGVQYTGGDIVRDIVDKNNSSFGKENRRFEYMDIVSGPLPKADLILCRDCLVHLSFGDGLAALDQFRKSGAKWLLTTTFTDRDGNAELCEGLIWRPLNLEKPPYNLPKAERYINEGCTEDDGMFGDKCLGLWKLH